MIINLSIDALNEVFVNQLTAQTNRLAQAVNVYSPIYGVSWTNDLSTTMTRTDDAVNMTYAINSSSGTISSDFDTVFPFNAMSIVTDNSGNKFLHIPSMYFRITLDDNDCVCGVAVSKEQGAGSGWFLTKPFEYGIYGGSLSNNKLMSVSGVNRQYNYNRTGFRNYAQANVESGYIYSQLDLYTKTIMMFLWWIEFATKDSSTIMTGNESGTVMPTGGTNDLTSPSGFVPANGNQMRWHYIEDFIGNGLEFIDGTTGDGVRGGTQYVSYNPTKYNDTGEGMDTLSWVGPLTSGTYGKAFGWDNNKPFLVLPKITQGSSNAGFCDWATINNNIICVTGARWDIVDPAAGISRYSRYGANQHSSSTGARLIRYSSEVLS